MGKLSKTGPKVLRWGVAIMVAGAVGCHSSAGFLGLQDYQRDLLFGFGNLALTLLLQGGHSNTANTNTSDTGGDNSGAAQGAPGEPGQPGLACWDLNGNGVGDPNEDINH